MTVSLITKGMILPKIRYVNIGNILCPEVDITFEDELNINVEIQEDELNINVEIQGDYVI